MPSKHPKKIRRFAPQNSSLNFSRSIPKVRKISSLRAIWTLNLALFLAYASSFYGMPFLKSSVLEYSNLQSEAFDGTAMPVSYIPNWMKAQNTNKSLNFNQIPTSEFMEIPDYSMSVLENDNTKDIQSLIARFTYPVVYMGSYRLNYKEYDGSHLGVDIRAPIGTPVLAIANAVVVKVKNIETGDGKYVILRHDNVPISGGTETFYSSYLHLDEVIAQEGTKIRKGDVIGTVGITGITTTPHLHFQIDKDTAPFHTYWPYSFSDLRELGIDFFSAVNVGLGKENAIKHTIHPMEFVQKHRNAVIKEKSFSVASNTTLVAVSELNSAPAEPVTVPQVMPESTPDKAPPATVSVPDIKKPIVVDTFVRDATNIFRDVPPGSSFYESTKFLFEKGVTMGYSDASFNPKGTLTRGEALLMLFRYFQVAPVSSDLSTLPFQDVLPSSELMPYLAAALERKIISQQAYFRPNDLLTRGEAVTLMVRSTEEKITPLAKYKFSDVKASSGHATNINIFATALKLRGGNFYTDRPMTRGDLAKILYAWSNRK